MNRWILFLGLFISSLALNAHQPELSSTLLVEQDDNRWALVVRASMTAFEQEMKIHYPTAYQSEKAFKNLLIKHVASKLDLVFNQVDTASLQNGFVKLGHETNVVFEVIGVPPSMEALSIQNSSFKDIHHNQTAFIIIKKGFAKQQFILNKSNQHKASLIVADKHFVLSSQPDSEGWSWYQKGIVGLFMIGFSLLTFHFYKSQKQEKLRSPKEAPLPYANTIIRNLH